MKRLKIILQSKLFYIVFFIFSLIYCLFITNFINLKSIYNGNETNFKCVILEYNIDGNKLDLTLNCKEKMVAYYYIKSIDEKETLINSIKYGSSIDINGILYDPLNNTIFNLYNYKNYLKNNKIYYKIKISSYIIDNSDIKLVYKIKNYFYKRANYLNNKYIYALVLGNKSFVDEDILEEYKIIGISHLLALSGLHATFLSFLLLYIFKKVKINEIISIIISTIFLLIIFFISGKSVSFLRAISFFLLFNMNKKLNLNIKSLYILLFTLSLFLIINPFNLFSSAFIYSFTITFFIISFFNNKHYNYTKKLIIFSIISYISSLGLNIYYNGYINLISPLINMLLMPLFSFIIYPVVIFAFIFPFLNNILNLFINIFELLSSFFNDLSLVFYFPKPNLLLIIIYYILLYLLITKRKIIYIFGLMFLLLAIKFNYLFNNYSSIYYLDVNQGDSSLIVGKRNAYAIMIDTGGIVKKELDEWKKSNKEYSIVRNKTITFLRSIGINKINTLIITHGDYDHMGEAINLVNNFKVEKVIFNCGPYNDLEKELIKLLDKKKIKYYSCINELNIDNNKLYFLQTKEYDNENDNSNVIYTEIDGYKFMFMGDAGTEKEKDILERYDISDIDVLKVGHHGSKTSSSESFINEINPKYSIISIGKNNKYGHPNKEVLNNLESSKIYRTDQDGSIMFKIKNNTLKVETCSP